YLTGGQQIGADAQGILGHIAAVPSDGIAPWRNGRLSFINARLDRVLAEFRRYGDVPLRIREPQVAALRLSGTFDPQDPGTLQRILPAALPVRLQQSAQGIEIRSRE